MPLSLMLAPVGRGLSVRDDFARLSRTDPGVVVEAVALAQRWGKGARYVDVYGVTDSGAEVLLAGVPGKPPFLLGAVADDRAGVLTIVSLRNGTAFDVFGDVSLFLGSRYGAFSKNHAWEI